MGEMLELANSQSAETLSQAVIYTVNGKRNMLPAGPAHFGKQLRGEDTVSSKFSVRKIIGLKQPVFKKCSFLSINKTLWIFDDDQISRNI